MAVFPSISPVYPAPKRSSFGGRYLKLGDGYASGVQFGLNPVNAEWQLTWEVIPEEAQQIEEFLQSQADLGESFEWQPPDSSVLMRWRCDEWDVTQPHPNRFNITATFRRVYAITLPELIAATAQCDDSTACVDSCFDFGPDLWVSRLTEPYYSIDPSSELHRGYPDGHTVVTDSKGFSYTVWVAIGAPGAPRTLAIAKRTPSGSVLWWRDYNDEHFCSITQVIVADIDTNDGLGHLECLVILGQTDIPWWNYGLDEILVIRLDGEYRQGYGLYGAGATQMHTDGIYYVKSKNHLIVMRHNYVDLTWDVFDTLTGDYVDGWNVHIVNSYYAQQWLPSGESSYIEHEDGTGSFIYNIGGNNIYVFGASDYVPLSADRYYYTGNGCVASRYGSGFVVATAYRFLVFTNDRTLIRVVSHGEGKPSQILLTDDLFYMTCNKTPWMSSNTPNRADSSLTSKCVVFDRGLTTRISRIVTHLFNGPGWTTGGSVNYSSNASLYVAGKRMVVSADTIAPYGQSAPSGSALFYTIGVSLDQTGEMIDLYTGGNTARTQLFTLNEALPTYYAADGPVYGVWYHDIPTYERSGMANLVGNKSGGYIQLPFHYLWDLYSINAGN